MMNETLLIVDNDESILKCFDLMLKSEFEILTAHSGHKALEILKKHKVDCIISDFDMSDGNGLYLLKNLENREIPFILITGQGEKDLFKTFANEKAFHIYEKPIHTNIKLVIEDALKFYRKSQKQLKESLIGRNTAHILHDLNNGLSIIEGAASAGLSCSASETSEFFLMSLRACKNIETLIFKYKNFMNNGDGIRFSKINLSAFINNLLKECKTCLKEDVGFEFENSVTEEVEIFADVDFLRQVLLNLISNSIYENKSRRNPSIKISISKNEKNASLSICDPGSISDEIAASLFQEGFTTKKEKGTGMGLYYCKNLLQKMNADIYLAKKSPSTFTIAFNTLTS